MTVLLIVFLIVLTALLKSSRYYLRATCATRTALMDYIIAINDVKQRLWICRNYHGENDQKKLN